MSDEIKEILDKFKIVIRNDLDYMLRTHNCKILLDYITNLQTIEREYSSLLSENAELQQENDRLNNIINELEKYCWELKAMGCREGALDMLDKIEELKENNNEC